MEDMEKEMTAETTPENETGECVGEQIEEKGAQAETSEELTQEPAEEEQPEKSEEESMDSSEESEEETMDSSEEAAGDTAGSRFKGRKNKKDKKDEQIEELNERYLRQLAEFDNFRTRTEKEKTQMFETGAKSVIEKILPIIDNFERGLSAISEEEKGGSVADGMEKIYKQFLNLFDELGVKEIEAEGAAFDPDLHYAVMHIEDENFGENVVAEVLQKGYTYRDSVIRYSMVKVAN